MKPKRWIVWTCFVLLLAGEGMLFTLNQQKRAVQGQLHDAQQQLAILHQEMDQFRMSSAIVQSNELARLRRENTNIFLKLTAALDTVKALSGTNAQLASDLDATRELAVQQQDQMQEQMQTDDGSTNAVDSTPAVPLAVAQRNECINNLRLIDSAKQQWAIDKNKGLNAVPTVLDLLPYLPDGFPVCPVGGRYNIRAVEDNPTCSIAGHVLSQ
jgi:hypothetical protein